MVKVKSSAPINKPKIVTDKKTKNKIMKINERVGRSHRGKRRIWKKERQPAGVVYISHIPHGFYEEQIEAYFSQFGRVNAVSVPRSKSGRARGYAFIEYKYPEIAKIAADTMNNYLMLNRLLKAKYIAPEQQKPRLFRLALAARENHQTAADKAALAVKRNRKLKNRHLKLSLEAKYAAKLLKKRHSLTKRIENLGLSHDFLVEEANLQSIFEQKKEMVAKKKSRKQDLESEKGEETDTSEEQLSTSEDTDDTHTLESNDSSLEDKEAEDFLLESEKEDRKIVIAKAKKAAKDILKKTLKSTKRMKTNKGSIASNVSPELSSQNQNNRIVLSRKKRFAENKNKPRTDKLESPKINAKSKKPYTPLKVKLPRKNAVDDDVGQNENNKPKKSKQRKRLTKNNVTSLTEKTPLPVKKIKASSQTLTNKNSNIVKVVMEVDKNDEEINFKTPPNVVKHFIKTGQDSVKKNTGEKSIGKPLLASNKRSPSKKTHQGVKLSEEMSSPTLTKSLSGKKLRHRAVKSPNKIISPIATKSPSGKKLRHRQLKHLLTAAQFI